MITKKRLLTPLLMILGVSGLYAEENVEGKVGFATCQACHGPDGKGLAVGDKKMAASLPGSKIVNGKPEVFALAVMKGIKQENANYMVPMAPLEAVFTDNAKFAAVLTYVRQSFGNTSSAVTAEDVAKFRIMWKDQKDPVTRAKLEELNKVKSDK
jgi:mono/diheme cytochrome c family protein